MDRQITAVLRLPAVRLGLTYAVGCIAAACGDDFLRIILLSGAAVLTAACFAMRREKMLSVGLLLGVFSMSAYMWFYCQPLTGMSGSEIRTSCRVTSVSYYSKYFSAGRALCVLNGFPALIDFTGNYSAQSGDVLDVTITLARADEGLFTFSDGVVLEGGVQEIHSQRHSFSLLGLAGNIRSAAGERLDVLGGDEAALCKGLLLGDTSGFSMKLKRDITWSGLNYMTAVSGAHITLVLMILMELFGRGKRSQAYIAIAAVPLLAVLFGFSPSVMRAGLMMLIAKCSLLFCRRAETMNSLCAAFLALTILAPYAAADPALQMSVLGVFGAAVLGRYLNGLRKFRFEKIRALAKLKEAAVLSLCAMICIAPVSISCFGGISLAEVPASVAAAPLFTAGLTLGVLFLASGIPLLALPLLWVMKGFCGLLGVFGGIPRAWLPADHPAMVPLAFLADALLVIGVFRADSTKLALQGFTLSVVLFVCVGSYGNYTRNRIDMISDGRSGAAVICTGDEASVMISGTGSGLKKKLFNEFMRSGITHVRMVNAPQLDYAGMAALSDLAELFPVDELLAPYDDGVIIGGGADGTAADSIKVNGRTIVSAKSGDESVSGDIVMYWGYTRSVPANSAGLPLYVSAWQNQVPYNGVNIYDKPLRVEL